MVFLAKNPIVLEYDLSSLKIVISGSAPLSKNIEEIVKKRLGIPLINQIYGMTETTTSAFTHKNQQYKFGSVGVLKGGIMTRIVDIKSGRNLGPNEHGELFIKGKIIMKGYIDDNVATNNIIDGDGWLHTGDIAYFDNDGYFFIVDRIKELIKYKGNQVAPAEIENILLQHPKINDAAVIGIADEEAGELPFAFVVKHNNASITTKEVIDFVAGTIIHFFITSI